MNLLSHNHQARLRTLGLAAALLLAACDPQAIKELEEGVSTEADVVQRFGQPERVWPEAGGARTYEYNRQPEGLRNYMITIGADGKMSALRQVLKPAEFAKVVAGMDKTEVRRALGKPAKTVRFDLKPDEEHWDWRWLEGQQPKLFSVTFDRDGKVLKTAMVDDPEATRGAP